MVKQSSWRPPPPVSMALARADSACAVAAASERRIGSAEVGTDHDPAFDGLPHVKLGRQDDAVQEARVRAHVDEQAGRRVHGKSEAMLGEQSRRTGPRRKDDLVASYDPVARHDANDLPVPHLQGEHGRSWPEIGATRCSIPQERSGGVVRLDGSFLGHVQRQLGRRRQIGLDQRRFRPAHLPHAIAPRTVLARVCDKLLRWQVPA